MGINWDTLADLIVRTVEVALLFVYKGEVQVQLELVLELRLTQAIGWEEEKARVEGS